MVLPPYKGYRFERDTPMVLPSRKSLYMFFSSFLLLPPLAPHTVSGHVIFRFLATRFPSRRHVKEQPKTKQPSFVKVSKRAVRAAFTNDDRAKRGMLKLGPPLNKPSAPAPACNPKPRFRSLFTLVTKWDTIKYVTKWLWGPVVA